MRKTEQAPETDFAATHGPACPFSGQGGSYVIENGVRRLESRTDLDAAAIAEANAQADTARATEKE